MRPQRSTLPWFRFNPLNAACGDSMLSMTFTRAQRTNIRRVSVSVTG